MSYGYGESETLARSLSDLTLFGCKFGASSSAPSRCLGLAQKDEIWFIRINPQEQYNYAFTADIGLDDIKDRENALAGNLSLNQEIDHIVTVNNWIEKYGTDQPPLNDRKMVKIRTIKMTQDTAWGLKYTSEFDRSAAHLNKLHDEGRSVGAQ